MSLSKQAHVADVLNRVRQFNSDVLAVDDGSTDGTGEILDRLADIQVVKHPKNLGYGAALRSAFEHALAHNYDVLVTIDCDGQHEPQRIGDLAAACRAVDIASGSRYLQPGVAAGTVPADRRRINFQITEELNCRLGLNLTDAFCGFKAYRVATLAQLELTESGYGMPLELWVQAALNGLKIVEVAVPLIYLDEERSFGPSLDDDSTRLRYYHQVIDQALQRAHAHRGAPLPANMKLAQDDDCRQLLFPTVAAS